MCMKISQLDIAISEDYDNFAEKLISYIGENFYDKGYNSILMAKLISYLRKEFFLYSKLKLNKDVNVKVIIPKAETRFLEKNIKNNKEEIVLRYSYPKALDLLNGANEDFQDDIYDLIQQFETYVMSDQTEQYNKYLISQVITLSELCYNELKITFTDEVIQRNLIKQEGWRRLSKKSSIFNDYYKLFNQDKEKYSKIFSTFLKNIAKFLDK